MAADNQSAGEGATHPTCVLGDGHGGLRESLALLLEHEGYAIVGVATAGEEALRLIVSTRPQVAVLDLHLDGMNAAEIARRAGPSCAVVIHTSEIGSKSLAAALEAGVRGVVLTAVPPTALIDALAAVASGGSYLDPSLPTPRL